LFTEANTPTTTEEQGCGRLPLVILRKCEHMHPAAPRGFQFYYSPSAPTQSRVKACDQLGSTRSAVAAAVAIHVANTIFLQKLQVLYDANHVTCHLVASCSCHGSG
jgi:hypothetical protein